MRDAADPAFMQIAFLNFPFESSITQRLDAMQSFMRTNFPKITPVSRNMFSDTKGDASVHGFVQVVDNRCARRIIDECKSRKLVVSGFENVKIKRAKSAIDRNRDWALYRSEELIKAHPSAFGKDVRRERGSETRERGIYVDDVRAFEQAGRYSKDGVFLHAFSNLQLR